MALKPAFVEAIKEELEKLLIEETMQERLIADRDSMHRVLQELTLVLPRFAPPRKFNPAKYQPEKWLQ